MAKGKREKTDPNFAGSTRRERKAAAESDREIDAAIKRHGLGTGELADALVEISKGRKQR